ncbi:MAG: DUF58 domain-containing protein [Spirochaetales bacterium]|nr:DUF58 domain-containing protein [Spirochaetales bacterium]
MDQMDLFAHIKHIPLLSSRLSTGLLAGNYRSVFRGPGLEFDEVREYAPGDDARFIDWNVSSRMGTPYSKTFREERELHFFILLDVSASVQLGSGRSRKLDTACLTAALLSYAASRNNDRVGALFFTDRIEKYIPPDKGDIHVARFVQDMLSLQPQGTGSDLALGVRTAQEMLTRRGICVILSDFRVSGGWKELSLLGRRHDVIAVKITDPLEYRMPARGYVELTDPETGVVVRGKTGTKGFRKEYTDFWEAQDLYWRRQCRRRSIDSLTIDTEDDPVEKLLAFFDRRKKR